MSQQRAVCTANDMETRNRNLPLRILYTVSGSQYILARSSSSVPVLLVPHTHTGFDHTPVEQANPTRPEFGTASLKTCLDAICISSPELVQDKRRDFSVYVLDPLESNSAPAQVNIPNAVSGSQSSDSRSTPEQPRGLAVALGLMSWALMLDERDSTPVTGTVIKLPTGQEALEIIFALKEVRHIQLDQNLHYNYLLVDCCNGEIVSSRRSPGLGPSSRTYRFCFR